MPTLCHLANIDNISLSGTETLKFFLDVIEVYSREIDALQKSQSKLSSVIPSLLIIFSHLLKTQTNENIHIRELAIQLKEDLINRTKFIFEPTNRKFAKIFSLATFLDPNTRKYFGIRLPVPELSLVSLRSTIKLELETLVASNYEPSVLDGFLDEETDENEIQLYLLF